MRIASIKKIQLYGAVGPAGNRALLAGGILYALLVAFLTIHHEPWRDEAYPWLIARELDFFSIYREVSYNGAPSLWYYVLAIPAKLGLPYTMMHLIHWTGACVMVALFLRYAPFTVPLKLLCVFGYYFAYEHAVIARGYMGSILFIFALCSLYPRRYERPAVFTLLVVLLANTSFFGTMAACFFFAESLLLTPHHARRYQLVMLAGILAAIVNYIPQHDAYSYYRQSVNFYRPNYFMSIFGKTFLPPLHEFFLQPWQLYVINKLRDVAAPLMIILLTCVIWSALLARAWLLAAFLVSSTCVIAYLTVFKYPWAAERHFSFILIYLLMALWLIYQRRPQAAQLCRPLLVPLLYACFACNAFITYGAAMIDIKPYPFSGAKDMANYIRTHGLEDEFLVSTDTEFTAAILPYLPKSKTWDAEKERFVRYSHTNSYSRRNLSMTYILKQIRRLFPENKRFYIISKYPANPKRNPELLQMHFSPGIREAFFLYLLDTDLKPPPAPAQR